MSFRCFALLKLVLISEIPFHSGKEIAQIPDPSIKDLHRPFDFQWSTQQAGWWTGADGNSWCEGCHSCGCTDGCSSICSYKWLGGKGKQVPRGCRASGATVNFWPSGKRKLGCFEAIFCLVCRKETCSVLWACLLQLLLYFSKLTLCVCVWGKSFLRLLGMGWCWHSVYENDVERSLGTQGGVMNFQDSQIWSLSDEVLEWNHPISGPNPECTRKMYP